MFFYLIHNINHSLFRKETDSEGTINLRTFIIGGILYIIAQAYLWTPNNPFELYKYSLWYILILDLCSMGYLYKSYFGRNIVNEIDSTKDDEFDFDENTHKYSKKQKDKVIDNNVNNNNNNEIDIDNNTIDNNIDL